MRKQEKAGQQTWQQKVNQLATYARAVLHREASGLGINLALGALGHVIGAVNIFAARVCVAVETGERFHPERIVIPRSHHPALIFELDALSDQLRRYLVAVCIQLGETTHHA